MLNKDLLEIFNKINSIGIDFLENTNLLEKTIKELVINKLIEDYIIDVKQSEEIFDDFLKKNGISDESKFKAYLNKNNSSKISLQKKILRSLKIQKLYLDKFKTEAKDYFTQNKDSFNKVTYALIRTSNLELAKELYLQIEAKENNIYDLAGIYSQGVEKFSKGIVGPISLNQIHKEIRGKIKNSIEGELMEPFQIENWWNILKIEKFFEIKYSEQIEKNICMDLFEKRILKTSTLIIKKVRSKSECD